MASKLPYPLRPLPHGVRRMAKDFIPDYHLLVLSAPTRRRRKAEDRLVLVHQLGDFEDGDEVVAVFLRDGRRVNMTSGAALCMLGSVTFQRGTPQAWTTGTHWIWRSPVRIGKMTGAHLLSPLALISPDACLHWFGTDDLEVKAKSTAIYRELYFSGR